MRQQTYYTSHIPQRKGALSMEENKEIMEAKKENSEILELLQKIEKSNRQQARTEKLMCVFALITAICCIVTFVLICSILPQVNSILPQINSILPQIDTMVSQMQAVLSNLEEATAQLAALDFESMVSDVGSLVVTGQQSLEQTMEKLNSIDFDTLNQAIKDLADVIEPLAKITKIF